MGAEDAPSTSPPAAGPSCSSSSPCGKRVRDPEDEVYLDNFHNHKRYLSQIMATSLNGLTVGDPLGDNLMESPARSDVICYLRDEIISPYSPMSEDSDDLRYCDTQPITSLLDSNSRPTSPVSPHRHQKQVWGLSPSNPYPLPGCTLPAVVCSQPRQRSSDTEVRFPSSPNDMCHTADLRRAALLRSVQMRTQPSSAAYELAFENSQDDSHCIEEVVERSFLESKALEEVQDAKCECPAEQAQNMLAEFCSDDDGSSNCKCVCKDNCCNID